MKFQLNEPQEIVLLNGPSSAGKSTLSYELQKQIKNSLNLNYSIVSIDDYMQSDIDGKRCKDDILKISGDMCKQVIKDLKKHDGVIIDHLITSEKIFKQLEEMLSEYAILLVLVTAPLTTLQEREAERGNRYSGLAEDTYENLFPRFGYDITVDTCFLSTKTASLKIIHGAMV